MVEEDKGKSVFRSQFSMGQLDFIRYDKLLAQADEEGVRVENGDNDAIRPYFSILKQFYKQIRWLVIDRKRVDELRDKIDIKLRNLNEFKRKGSDTSIIESGLKKELDEFSDKVYEAKQRIGMGIEVQKVLSMKKKWERAARLAE